MVSCVYIAIANEETIISSWSRVYVKFWTDASIRAVDSDERVWRHRSYDTASCDMGAASLL